ncbi:MAG: hypothetical protein JKY95_08110 [Planctomycetaceae bacterium]|nr:hypothetical protein [Planctomycetaceae bacterium]
MFIIPSRTGLLIAIALFAVLLLGSPVGAEKNCQAGYWIVNTYDISQEEGACPSRLKFRCYYKPNCGKMRRVSYSQMQRSLNPAAATCIMVHGSSVGVDTAIMDANNTYSWIKKGAPGCALNMIFFVWPGDESLLGFTSRNVKKNGIIAAQNGIYLGHLIDRIPSSSPVCLLGHSHGARTVVAALHYRGGGRVNGVCKGNRSGKRPCRAVLAAAAINHMWLNPNNKYGLAVSQVDKLLNIVNRRDMALALYPLAAVSNGRAFAKTGLTRSDKKKLGHYACRVHELDATSVIGFRHTWPNYYGRPELAKIIAPYVYSKGRHRHHSNSYTDNVDSSQESTDAEIVLPELLAADEVTVAKVPAIPPVALDQTVITK